MESLYLIFSEWLVDTLNAQTGLMFFLILGLGYALGNLRIRNFSVGPVAGVLFVGLIFGHFGYRISSAAQMVGFALFIFSVGYQAGPGFIAVLKKDGFKYLLLSFVVAFSGFITALLWAMSLELPAGMSAGLLAGGLTSSPTLAAAQDAVYTAKGISHQEAVIDNIATGYALTYIFGLVGLIMVIRYLPKAVGIDLKKEAQKFQEENHHSGIAAHEVTVRTYKITDPQLCDKSSDELRAEYWDRKAVVRVIRGGNRLSLDDAGSLELGDIVEIIGSRQYFTDTISKVAQEIYPKIDTVIRQESAQAVVTNSEVVGQKLADIEISKNFGLFLLEVLRDGKVLQDDNTIVLKKGDLLSIIGAPDQIDSFSSYIGHVEREAVESDITTLSFGIIFGLIVGSLSVTVGGISLSLGSAGGLLVSGLFIGYRRSIKPTFGRLPESTRWFLMEFGLLLFMAGVGLRAGGSILDALMQHGIMIILAGITVTLVPILMGYFVGHKLLKISPALLFGAITGAMTSGAALSVVIKEAKSPVPSLGYTGTYAFANVFLVVAGSLIIMF